MLEEIILASPRGFCAGVDMAIETVEEALRKYGRIHVRHEIIHNKSVIAELTEKGATFIEKLDQVPEGSRLIYSAHGVPPSVRQEAARRGLKTIDATCPLVEKVHREVKRYAQAGYSIILIGHKGHVEMEGTFGEAPAVTYIVGSAQEAERVTVPNPEKVAYATQTTLSVDETRDIIAVLKTRFPSIEGPRTHDICYATQNRQDAVKELARITQLVLVIGSKNSSNSTRLAEVARETGVPAYLIDHHSEIQGGWLDGLRKVGVTAGASGPEYLVQGTVRHLQGLYPAANVQTLRHIEEPERTFRLPEI